MTVANDYTEVQNLNWLLFAFICVDHLHEALTTIPILACGVVSHKTASVQDYKAEVRDYHAGQRT